jgi:hypothetical protein
MTPFYNTNLLKVAQLFRATTITLACLWNSVFAMETLNILTTDSSVLHTIQEISQTLATSKKLNVSVSLLDETRLTRSLQLGKKGDVLITSDVNLCQGLVTKGLASPLEFQKIIQEEIYCTSNNLDGKVLMLMPEKMPSITQEKITNIAIALNASVYVFAKNEDAHRKMEEWTKFRIPVCGFSSAFASLNIKKSALIKTNAAIEYFSCPLIGIKQDGYSILINHYETQNNY